MQRSVVGATNLNIALQEAINPVGDSLSRGGFRYRRGDRVMQIRNNYDKDVFNGDIGTVEHVDMEERTLTVSFMPLPSISRKALSISSWSCPC